MRIMQDGVETFEEWRQRMLAETCRFIEWGLQHPEQVDWIPRHAVGGRAVFGAGEDDLLGPGAEPEGLAGVRARPVVSWQWSVVGGNLPMMCTQTRGEWFATRQAAEKPSPRAGVYGLGLLTTDH
jgi:hypothetical protein